MSVGAEEEFESEYVAWQFTSNVYRMASILRSAHIAGLELTVEAFLGETHMTVWPTAFIHGVQAVFGKRVRRGHVQT
jgi:hypothetical protein